MKKIIIILLIAFSSCSSNSDIDESLSEIGIKLKDKYEILNNDSSSAIGDFTKSFDLIVSEKDFNIIIAKLKLVKKYAEYKENDSPNSFSEMSNNDKQSAYKIGNRYFYNFSRAKTNEQYQVILIEPNKLSFMYGED